MATTGEAMQKIPVTPLEALMALEREWEKLERGLFENRKALRRMNEDEVEEFRPLHAARIDQYADLLLEIGRLRMQLGLSNSQTPV